MFRIKRKSQHRRQQRLVSSLLSSNRLIPNTAVVVYDQPSVLVSDDIQDVSSVENSTFRVIQQCDNSEPCFGDNQIVKPFSQGFREWAVQHNIRHTALRDLLKLFPLYPGIPSLPLDPRTLMETPRELAITTISGGTMVYFGVIHNILRKLEGGISPECKHSMINGSLALSISISIDGLPKSKSNNKHFWPLQASVDQCCDSRPFLICIYYGSTKPSDTNFLGKAIHELQLLEVNGIVFKNSHYRFRVSKILADAPARSFIKGIKNHNSYNGCERCVNEGEWLGRVIFPKLHTRKRTDCDFRNKEDPDHHSSDSLFSTLEIGLVTQVPLDYQHLVCLGVTRKLIRHWVKGKLPHRIRHKDVEILSKRLLDCRKLFPVEFQRKPRSLTEIDHFKASEFRTLLLYTGPVIFKGIISPEKYNHFLLLHLALFILLSDKANNAEWNGLANTLLLEFVEKCKSIYGLEYLVYNVHNLIHLTDDAILFGSLDNISCFKYENNMQVIKKLVHSGNFQLNQVAKRIIERECVNWHSVGKKHDPLSSLTRYGVHCLKLISGAIILVSKLENVSRDKCSGEIIRVSIVCKEFKSRAKLTPYPVDSSKLGIFIVDNATAEFDLSVSRDDVLYSCILLPYEDSFVCIPLLHTII